MDKIIKVVLSVLFLLCLLDMPYGFFQVVRFAALIGFSVLAYHAKEKESKSEMILFICLAILFQPLIKIELGRQIWNFVDVTVVVFLLSTMVFGKSK